MSFQSAQTNFKGQHGWNDLAPDALELSAAARATKGRSKPRRVITPHDISSMLTTGAPKPPQVLAPAPPPQMACPPLRPPSAASSASSAFPSPSTSTVSVNSTLSTDSWAVVPPPAGPPRRVFSQPMPTTSESVAPLLPVSAKETGSQCCNAPVSLEEVQSELQALHARCSSPTNNDVNGMVQRVERLLPTLSTEHLAVIQNVLLMAGRGSGGKQDANKALVRYSLEHSNVTGWTVPLRRLIDQQKTSLG